MAESKDAISRAYCFELGQWLRFSSYIIDPQGEIRPSPTGELTSYHPFDFYTRPVPEEVVLDILSGRKLGGLGQKPFFLHTLFASLDPEDTDEFLRFVNHFGLPYLEEPIGEYEGEFYGFPIHITFTGEDYAGPRQQLVSELRHLLVQDGMTPEKADALVNRLMKEQVRRRDQPSRLSAGAIRRSIPLKELLSELWLFRWTMEISVAYAGGGQNLDEILRNGARRITDTPEGFWWGLVLLADGFLRVDDHDDLLGVAGDLLEKIMRENLAGVRPALTVGRYEEVSELREKGLIGKVPFSLNFDWMFDSLLSAIYLMLLLDITQGKLLRRCSNSLCGNFFVAMRPDNLYCSSECQNRAKQRRFKARRKAASAKTPQPEQESVL